MHVQRSLIHPSQHPAVDSLLKSFKLIARRIQSVLTIHETELQILQRLYYKNKNQHRSAVFWRNISEIRRYSRRVVDLKLLENIQALRLAFHGSVRSTINSVKGPWTHFPDREYLLNISTQVRIAKRLATKMSEACSKAYSSCHNSLQSGAFLNVLLVIVAITSRMGMIAVELNEICELSTSCIYDLLVISREPDMNVQAVDPFPSLASEQNIEQGIPDSATPLEAASMKTSAVIIKEKNSEQSDRREEIPRMQPKKKRKAKRDEIDDIFGS